MKYFLILTFTLLIFLDQASKSIYAQRVVFNQGFAFGLNQSQGSHDTSNLFQKYGFNTFLHGLILLILSVIFFKNCSDYTQTVNSSFVFLLSGGLSNFIDRFFYQGVRDWLHLPLLGIKNNLADIYVNLGVIILLILNIKWLIRKKRTQV